MKQFFTILLLLTSLVFAEPFGLKWQGMKSIVQDDGSILLEDNSQKGGPYLISNKIPVDSTKNWKIYVKARAENVTGRVQVYLKCFDATGKLLGYRSTNTIHGTKDWTPLTIELTPSTWPKGTAALQILLQPAAGPAEGMGKAWFRDLKFGTVEAAKKIPGKECTGEFVLKRGNIVLSDKKLKQFPFEHAPSGCRLELYRKEAVHLSALQIFTDENLGEEIQISPWTEGKEQFAPLMPIKLQQTSCGYLLDISSLPATRKLALVFPDKEKLIFDRLQVSRSLFPEENWQANWIWFTKERVEMIYVHLRKEFELKSLPTKAMWQCAADDGATVYLNGKRQHNVDGRFTPPNDDVLSKLKVGKNIITVEVHQGRYAAGFLGELDLDFADGSHQKIITDKSWKYYPAYEQIIAESKGALRSTLPADWSSPNFNDQSLKNCVELGVPPLGVWGAIKYRMNAPRIPLYIVKPAYPLTIEAGKLYNQTAVFHTEKPCKEPTPIRLQLHRGTELFREWEIGIAPVGKKDFSFPFSLQTTPFLAPGDYQMKLVMSGYVATCQNGGKCDIQNITVINERHAIAPTAKIQRDKYGVPTLTIDGKPYESIFSAKGNRNLNIHGAQFNRAGLHLYHVYLTPYWPKPDTPCFIQMDAIAEKLLQYDPQAKFMMKIEMRDGKPNWYLPLYPEDTVTYENGAKAAHISLASKRWKKLAGDYIRGLIAHIEKSPYADHVIGYIPAEGEEGQWMHYWGGNHPEEKGTLSDYSPAMLQYFQEWLTRKYKNDQALQKSWNNPTVTLNTATIPTKEERCAGVMSFRALPENQKAADFGWALSDVVSDGMLYYAKIIKEATKGKALTGALYGHLMDLGGSWLGEQVGYAKQRLPIETPYVDFYFGPISYSHRFRDVGYPGGYDMPSPGSLELHNKIWVNEDDLRTHLNFPADYAYSVRTPADTTQQLAREVVKAICGRAGFYYFPLGENGVYWYDDPETLDTIQELTRIGEECVTGDRSSISEIAVFFDDETQCRLRQRSGGKSPNSCAIMQREAIFRIGAPVDEFLQFDIANPKLKKYKFYIFLNPYFLKPEEIASITKLAKHPQTHILFCYVPGIAGDKGFDITTAQKLTGLKFTLEKTEKTGAFQTSQPFGALPAGKVFGSKYQFGPVAIPSGQDETLATFSDGKPAIVRKGNIYVACLAELPVEMLRHMAIKANVPLLSQDNIAVYGCRQYVGFHSSRTQKTCVFKAPAGKKIRQLWPLPPQGTVPVPITEYKWNNTTPKTILFEVIK